MLFSFFIIIERKFSLFFIFCVPGVPVYEARDEREERLCVLVVYEVQAFLALSISMQYGHFKNKSDMIGSYVMIFTHKLKFKI